MKLLIIDDEENMCHMLKAMVERHGYEVTTAYDGKTALELIDQERFDFILCDVKMPHIDGMMFLEKGAEDLKDSTVIMMSAFGTVDLALEAMKAGAYDFISKPFKSDEVLLALKKAEEREQLKRENRRLKEEIADIQRDGGFGRMVAVSSAMKNLFELARKVASYDTTVLITGDSGTGKELVAEGIHQHSDRRDKEFVAINCGSIPEHLLESEFFGHMKGAFTGADRTRKGLFEEANGGTLFLDEIGDLPLNMQVKLLRVLQEQEIRPVGASQTKNINVRVLAATAKDLSALVTERKFRDDLYYRLNVIPITIPSLKDRQDDIPVLCHYFVKKINSRLDTAVNGISPDSMKLLLAYRWPGNVRELENVMQRCIVLTSSDRIEIDDLPGNIKECKENNAEQLSLKLAQKKMEAKFIAKALKTTEGNKSKAASLLEISYPSLLSKIKGYRL